MNAKSMMQTLNLGLSIFNKVQMIQHRNIKMAQSLRPESQPRHGSISSRRNRVQDAEVLEPTVTPPTEI